MKLMAKKRLLKVALFVLTAFATLPFVVYLLLINPRIQTYLIQKATQFLKNEYGITVEIGRIEIRPITSLVLKNLYVEDLSGDTLFYAKKISTAIRNIKPDGPQLYFDNIQLDSIKLYLLEDPYQQLNIDRILSLFEDTTAVTDTVPSKFRIYSKKVTLDHSEFILKSYNTEPAEGVNFDFLHLRKISAYLSPLLVTNDTLKVFANNLTATDHSGLFLDSLSMLFISEPNKFRFENVKLHYGESNLNAKYIRLIKTTDTAFSNFLNQVLFQAEILPSKLSTQDLAWFAPEVKDFNLQFHLSGTVQGPVNSLNFNPLNIKLYDSLMVELNGNLTSVVQYKNLWIDLSYLKIVTPTQLLHNISILNDSLGHSTLPEELFRLKYINYSGKFRGGLSNFKSSGLLITDKGKIIHTLDYSADAKNNLSLKGELKANNLNVGQILDISPWLEKLDMEASFDGVIFSDNRFNTTLNVLIPKIDFNGYTYQKLTLKGEVSDALFDGDFTITDPNITLSFGGKIEYNTPKLNQRFLLNLSEVNLHALNFDPTPHSVINLSLVGNFDGLSPDQLNGKLNVVDLSVERNQKNLHVPKIDLMFTSNNTTRAFNLISPLVDIFFSGTYSYSTISDVLSNALSQYASSLAWSNTPVDKSDPTYFKAQINLINVQPIVNLFDTTLTISNNSTLEINYKNANRQLRVKGEIANVKYNEQEIKNIKIDGFNDESKITANIAANEFLYTNEFSLKNLSINSSLVDNKIGLGFTWNNYNRKDTTNYSGFISAQITLSENSYDLKFLPSYIVISDTTWQISPSSLSLKGDDIEVNNLEISHRWQSLKINGKISKNASDTITVSTQKVNLALSNILLKRMAGITIGGELTADIKASNLYDKPFVLAQIELDNFSYNGQLIGDTKISSSWDPLLEMIHVDWVSSVHNYDVLYIVGDYDPIQSFMNLRLFIDRFNLSILAPYLEGALNNLQGLMTAELIIKGNITDPRIEGVIIFDRTSFVVDYTKTQYQITDWVDIAPDAVIFSDFRIVDVNNNFMLLNGRVTHKNFSDFALDLRFNARNFMFLNTLEKDNPDFFGTVFASGNGAITGPLQKADIAASIKTEKNTRLFIPLNTGETARKASFITFVEPQTTVKSSNVTQDQKDDSFDVSLKLNLEVTPEAEVQIIFDPTIGDIIKAKGSSNLTIYMPRGQDLEIYGDYVISEGEYLFTLQDIFQKRFTIAKGSSIMWSGDPSNAFLDIDALYRVRRASLYELTFNPSDQDQRPTVDAHLLMGGTILNPTISFKITLPATAEEAQEQLNNLPHDEISKQVISLLILNRFQPLPGAVKTGEIAGPSGVESNASELLSNQVSNWLSQISNTFDIGFNYTPGGETTAQEYEVAVSTQLLNNRVIINTNVGMGGQQQSSTSQNSSNIAGDFEMEIKLDQRGRFRFKGYQIIDNRLDAHNKQGAGLFYREEFNTFSELWEKFFRTHPQNAQKK